MSYIFLTPATSHFYENFKHQGIIPVLLGVHQFLDGEFLIQLPPLEKLPPRGSSITLIHATCQPIHDNMILLILILRQLHEAGYQVRLILTYMGYARQSLDVIKEMISTMMSPCLQEVVLLDLHQSQIVDCFSVKASQLSCVDFFAESLKVQFENKNDLTIVAADRGGMNRAQAVADLLQIPMMSLSKRRDEEGVVHYMAISEPQQSLVVGKNVIIIDDITDSGQTLIKAACLLKNHGAFSVEVMATHGVFSGQAVEKLSQSDIKSISISNSICQNDLPSHFRIINIVPLLISNS